MLKVPRPCLTTSDGEHAPAGRNEEASCFHFERLGANECEFLQLRLQQVAVMNLHKQRPRAERLSQVAAAVRSLTSIAFNSCCHRSNLGSLSSGTGRKDELLSISFRCCNLGVVAVQTLRLMLKANSISVLKFQNCTFDTGAQKCLAKGLRANQSLKRFVFTGVVEPLKSCEPYYVLQSVSQNIAELVLNLSRAKHYLAVLGRLRMLKDLTIQHSYIDEDTIQVIASTCLESLSSLTFSHCALDPNVMDYLAQTLSDRVRPSFALNFMPHSILSETNRPFQLIRGTLKVQQMHLKSCNDQWHVTLDDIASNVDVKCLNLCNNWQYNEEALEKVCELFLRRNQGPVELILNQVSPQVNLIIEALQHNTSLKVLTIADLGKIECVSFARGLATMRGLRNLGIRYTAGYTKEFFQVLAQSLQVNTTLLTLTLDGIYSTDPIAKDYLPRIRYLLAINRVGRYSLFTAALIPTGLWAHILEKSAWEPEGIYFVLTGKPELVAPILKVVAASGNRCNSDDAGTK